MAIVVIRASNISDGVTVKRHILTFSVAGVNKFAMDVEDQTTDCGNAFVQELYNSIERLQKAAANLPFKEPIMDYDRLINPPMFESEIEAGRLRWAAYRNARAVYELAGQYFEHPYNQIPDRTR